MYTHTRIKRHVKECMFIGKLLHKTENNPDVYQIERYVHFWSIYTMEFYKTTKMNYYYIQKHGYISPKRLSKRNLIQRSHILHDFVYMNFKKRQNDSMVLKSELMITFGEKQGGND